MAELLIVVLKFSLVIINVNVPLKINVLETFTASIIRVDVE
jgi:hypothetical protein